MSEGYFIDFIRHGHAIPAPGSTSDRDRVLSKLGREQAIRFGVECNLNGEHYAHAIVSGVNRTVETEELVLQAAGGTMTVLVVPEMFNPEIPDKHSLQREAAYTKLGAQPLAQYRTNCPDAMKALGGSAAEVLLKTLHNIRKNTLVVGHCVYTNEIILSTFGRYMLSAQQGEFLTDSPLAECAGYRLSFTEFGRYMHTLDIHPIQLNC